MKCGRERKYPKIFFLALTVILSGFTDHAAAESVNDYLREFHRDPEKMMQRLPSFVDESGNAKPRGYIDENHPEWDEIIRFRDEVRTEIMGISPESPIRIFDESETGPEPDPNDAPSPDRDSPESIVDAGEIIKNIATMHDQRLTAFQLPTTPWSDSYWPIYKGITGNRYGDRGYPASRNWLSNFSYVRARSASSIFLSGGSKAVNDLSPSEKYDALMGDMSFSLTNFAWKRGQRYQEKYGKVPKWMGICHGWSAAASMGATYRKQPIVVKAVNGTHITLFPQDMKGLQSMLWAFAYPKAKFAGHRCSVSKPRKNRNGRILDDKCFDVSPHTWHMAVVNQMAVNKRSFVMDGTYDAEVWNFPLAKYRYRYFNPQTLQETVNMNAAIIPKAKFRVDKFPEFRDPKTKYVVGIYMDITYATEIAPRQRTGDVEPRLKTVRYIYDLELDGNKNIIGGEWYSNAHPDFLWTFNKTDQAQSKEDPSLVSDGWTIDQPIPGSWTEPAKRASAKGAPLWNFISRIVQ